MTSVLRSLSQIPVRSKFLVAFAADVSGSSAFAGEWMGSVIDAVVGTTVNFAQGALFRDLGREMMLVDAAGAHLALYREAMPQDNADAEGAALGDASVWLRVWAADGTGVRVARLG